MSTTQDALSPDEFSATAAEAVASCSGRGVDACAQRLAKDGLLGVLASEDVGGLGLSLAYAVPIAMQAGAGLLGFPLIETLLPARACAPSNATLSRALVAGEVVATMAWRGMLNGRRQGNSTTLDGTASRLKRSSSFQTCRSTLCKVS